MQLSAPRAGRASRTRPVTALVLAIAALAAASPSQALAARSQAVACRSASTLPVDVDTDSVRRATLCLLNEERERRGLARLRHNAQLAAAARRHARDMVTRSYFAHDSLSGASFIDRIEQTGYTRNVSWTLGENLAWGSGRLASPLEIVKAWMASPGHRANVLGRFREVGVGLAEGAPVDARGLSAHTYASEFGTRR